MRLKILLLKPLLGFYYFRLKIVIYAQTRSALKRKGRPIPMNDVWIAAHCLEDGWVLVTDDSDFDYVDGLVIEHW
ncbi:MAG: PIN domain-containing protein [Nostoc sp.]|uniref:PIN domain-containing protein n=1 Tax=Nostoc sp. TaxID=1180 RepID=UPI002FFD07DF